MDDIGVTSCEQTGSTSMSVVLNGTVLSLNGMTADGCKVELPTDKFETLTSNALIDDNGVLVDTGKGLVLSLADIINGQVTLSNLTSSVELNSAQLLAPSLLSAPPDGATIETSQLDVVSKDQAIVLESQALLTAASSAVKAQHESVLLHQPITVLTSCQPEVKKKKGGWPKGKKRKKANAFNPPRAPATGYVLFAIERRQDIRHSHPELSFPDVTKLLGNQWSAMSAEEKQMYIDRAKADKDRYIEELKDYQQSDAYQSFMKGKKFKESDDLGSGNISSESLEETLTSVAEDDSLHCKVCNQYFTSGHNRKEHMFGRQHLQNLTSDFQKALQEQDEREKEERLLLAEEQSLTDRLGGTIHGDTLPPDGASFSHCSVEGTDRACFPGSCRCICSRSSEPVSTDGFIQQFMERNYTRELETRELQKCLDISREKNSVLVNRAQELKEAETKMDQELATMKTICAALSAQIDGLKMVPLLFGLMNF